MCGRSVPTLPRLRPGFHPQEDDKSYVVCAGRGLRRDAREGCRWERPGGTAFDFINDGIETTLDLARAAACNPDARVAGVVAALVYPLDSTWTGVDTRSANFDLGSLTPYTREFRRIELDREKAEKAAEKYGVDLKDHPEGDAVARVPGLFRLASRMLVKDGYAAQVAWFFRGEDMVDMQATSYGDQSGKMLSMREMANRVRMRGADGFLYVSEMWTGKGPTREQLRSGEYVAARNQPDRGEALQVTGLTRDGRTLTAIAPFTRDAYGAVVIGEPEFEPHDQMALMSYRPIFQAWGIAEADPMRRIRDKLDAEDESGRDG